MRFDVNIPDPDTLRVGQEAYFDLPGGTEIHRIHPARFGPSQFNDTDLGDARFSPIRDGAGMVIPTIYAAQSFECATCEIILRCPDVPPAPPSGPPPLQIVFPRDFARHSHSVVRTTTDLKLVDLTTSGQRRIGVNGNALLAGPRSTYPVTRGWAEGIHAAIFGAQGLYYSSYQYGPHFALLLFGDRVPSTVLEPIATRSVADRDCHREIGWLARHLSIDYEDL